MRIIKNGKLTFQSTKKLKDWEDTKTLTMLFVQDSQESNVLIGQDVKIIVPPLNM